MSGRHGLQLPVRESRDVRVDVADARREVGRQHEEHREAAEEAGVHRVRDVRAPVLRARDVAVGELERGARRVERRVAAREHRHHHLHRHGDVPRGRRVEADAEVVVADDVLEAVLLDDLGRVPGVAGGAGGAGGELWGAVGLCV